MAGHSKWANIQHRKGRQDAARSKMFSKFSKEITVAAKMGDPDPDKNPRLRLAVKEAKSQSMPKENIDRAIKKAIGSDADTYEEIRYEGYGPGGVAVLVETMTDNKNRTVADVRHFFAKSGGNLGESGCVAWMFDKKGTLTVDKDGVTEEELMDLALEAGAEDVVEEEDSFQIVTSPETFNDVVDRLEKSDLAFSEASLSMVPKNTVEVTEEKVARSLMRLLENLEDHDDVQKVHANFDIDDSLMEQIS